ncbi:MAG TPA: guanylate kinase [Dissulfurispiraceae bacterium]|nr:guanylate kinase [Dissulfurispiraceae bacterium]
MRKRTGNLIVISAPSGAGKTTLCQKLLQAMPDVKMSVSFTTRGARQEEADGVHYSFISAEQFREMIGAGTFVEWAEVHGNYYGTSKLRILEILNSGADVILDIDVQGARQIRQHFPDSVHIFILPPSMEVLKQRLEGRMSDAPEVIVRRLLKARDEIRGYSDYNYVIINDILDEALEALLSVVRAERVRVERFDHDWAAASFLKEEQ